MDNRYVTKALWRQIGFLNNSSSMAWHPSSTKGKKKKKNTNKQTNKQALYRLSSW
jgi:hypothetical protein